MSTPRLYADYNATAPLRPEARAAAVRALDITGNTSSVHGEGRRAKAMVEDARERLGAAQGCRARDIVFTSGATESLHLALEAARADAPDAVFLGAMEHEAVWAYAHRLFPQPRVIGAVADGAIDLAALDAALDQARANGAKRPLVIIQAVNNETGVINPVARIAASVRKHGGCFLMDAVQALGKIEADSFIGVADWTIVSSHKIGGPMGAGALVMAPGAREPMDRPGGGQESGRRAGTPNFSAIAGFAAAVEAACAQMNQEQARTQTLRDVFETRVTEALPTARVIGAGARRVRNTSCIAMPGWKGETAVIAMDLAGAAMSAGAACSSGKTGASRTLLAIVAANGMAPALAGCASRASFGWDSAGNDGQLLAELYVAAARRRAGAAGEAHV
jgi:cysteine desulfurase